MRHAVRQISRARYATSRMCRSNQSKGQGMNDEDDDMLFSVLFVALTVAVVLFVVGGIGVVLWSVFA